MSLMSALYVGRSGLQISQSALNTTAHNISNAETAGYTRQQVMLGDYQYNTVKVNYKSIANHQLGLGVMYTSTRQVRDVFLDQTYRRENGRSAFYEVSYGTLTHIENILGEANDSSFKDSVERLWNAIEELSKEPDGAVYQGLFVQRASQFLDEANMVYKELNAYQDNLNMQVKDTVKTINDYGKMIAELNKQILKVEAGGVERANDLKDTRNYLLDQLSNLCNISYTEDFFGNVLVKIEGDDFVTSDNVYEIALDQDKNGFYTPYWPHMATEKIDQYGNTYMDISNAKVVRTEREISSAINTDIGKLEGLLYARGDHRANYTDMDPEKYDSISSSLVMNVQAEFDQLVHSIVTKINDILAEASDPASGYLCNPDGSPIQLFQKIATDNYVFNETTGEWEKMPEDPDRPETLYTLGNLIINQDLMKQPTLLSFVKGEGSTDFETAEKLVQAFEDETYILNPYLETPNNFFDYYISLINQVSNSGMVYKELMDDQNALVSSAEGARQQIIGVSTDEELTLMIQFQNAYNAASRYINTVNELLENLLNMG